MLYLKSPIPIVIDYLDIIYIQHIRIFINFNIHMINMTS